MNLLWIGFIRKSPLMLPFTWSILISKNSSGFYSFIFHTKTYVEVNKTGVAMLSKAKRGVALYPFTSDPYSVCHMQQFFVSVCPHVTHYHASKTMANIVNVNRHSLAPRLIKLLRFSVAYARSLILVELT